MIDWESIRARLKRAEEASRPATEASAERINAILLERARELAKEADSRIGEKVRNVLVFNVAGGQYGFDAHFASEILPLGTLTAIPRAPSCVAGVTSRRGEIVMLVNLARLLGLATHGIADLTRVVVIGPTGHEIGILVESVEGITELPADQVAPSLQEGRYVEGVAGGSLVLLNVPAVLSDPALSGGRPTRGHPKSTPLAAGQE